MEPWMEISSLQQHQQAMEESAPPTAVMQQINPGAPAGERKPRPQQEQALKCPRCDSTNTKFCYYNNYSLSQPRYFCKGCRRYWTQGGSLRNVPVGGGCRKNRRPSSSSSAPKKVPHHPQDIVTNSINAFLPNLTTTPPTLPPYAPFLLGSNPNPNPNGFLDILRAGFPDHHANGYNNNNLCGYGFDASTEYLPPAEMGLGLSSAMTMGVSSATAMADFGAAADGRSENNSNSTTTASVIAGPARDYWSTGSGYNWQGLINSSLM